MNKHVDELRGQVRDQTREQAEKSFADTRWDWLRPLARRRALVLLAFALVSLYGLAGYFDWPLLGLPALLAFMGCAIALRQVVRGITEYPDSLVDERMRQVRGTTYRWAFMSCIILMSLYMASYIVNQLLAKMDVVMPMTADQLHDLSFWLFFACMILPSALFAWTEPEL